MKKESNIFDRSGCLSDSALMLYIKGGLSVHDKKQAEQHIAHCEMCADAIEGLRMANSSTLENSISELHNRIDAVVAQKQKRNNTTWYYAAACIALLVGIGTFWIINLRQEEQEKSMAVTSAVELMPDKIALQDSITTEQQAPPAPQAKQKEKREEKQAIDEVAVMNSAGVAYADAVAAPEPELVRKSAKKKATPTNNLKEVEIVEYKVPVFEKDNTANTSTMTRDDIQHAPTRNVNSLASMAGGVPSVNISEMLVLVEKNMDKSNTDDTEMEETAKPAAASGMKKKTMRADAFEMKVDSMVIKPGTRELVRSIIIKIRNDNTSAALIEIELLEKEDSYTANYLEAAAMLKIGNKEKAILLLEELKEGNSQYRKPAKKILRKLN